MVNKDTKQNKKKKRRKERTASYHHLVVPIGTDVINVISNVHENVSSHEVVVEEHTVAATELVEEGSITDKDGNVTSFAEKPALHSPPPVNSKRKHNQEYESKHDENWNRLFIELVEYKQKNGHCNVPTTKNGTFGRWVSTQRRLFKSKKLKADRHDKLVVIGFTFVYESNIWNKHFMELVKYKEKNGHCNIPIKENGSLGRWVSTQRTFFKSNKLKEDRHEKLVGIGFAFEDVAALEFKGKLDQQWQDMYQKLLKHKETKGHCFDLPLTLPLGRWLHWQRQLYRNGNLRDDRAEKLLSIGFNDKKGLKKGGAVGVREASSGQPFRKKRKEEDLDNDLAAITHDEGEKGIDYINAEDDINDNDNASEEIVEEHTVAATELVEEGSITDKDGNVTSFAEMPMLHSPPPVNSKRKHNQEYESKHDKKWNKHFMELVEYKETNGHCNCPIKNNESLGMWIWHQRALFRSKKLKADRHEKLVVIGFTFVYESNIWNKQFMELVEYKEENGHCNCPTKNGSLKQWISRQRTLFRSKNLKADRYEKLVGIGFAFEDANFANSKKHTVAATELVEEGSITDIDENVTSLAVMPTLHSPPPVNSKTKYNQSFESKFDENWNILFMELVEYKKMNGHCNFPTNKGSFGIWVSKQRALFKSKTLKADRYEKLVGIGFAFEAALEFKGKLDQQWQDTYQTLLEYKETNGHCFDVPQTLPLGRWLKHQRQLYRNGNLRDDRAEKLLSIGFDDKHGLKKGGAVGVRDATLGQPPRKNRKVLDLDNDSAAITYDEGEEGIDYINANGDDNDNGNAHEEVIEKYTVTATELVEEGIKEGQKENDVAPPHLEENIEFMKTVQL
jgi:hypothetical protein